MINFDRWCLIKSDESFSNGGVNAVKKFTYQTVSKTALFTLFVPFLLTSAVALAEEGAPTIVESTVETTAAIEPNALQVANTSLSINVNEEQLIQVTVLPENAENKQVSWASANEQIAKVTDGRVQGLKAGATTITAKTVNGLEQKISVTVTDPVIEVTDSGDSGIRLAGLTSVLPQAATLKVAVMQQETEIYQKIKEETKGDIRLYDIQLVNQSGEVQPTGTVTVYIPVPKKFNPERVELYTYDAQTKQVKAVKGKVEKNFYVFETTHFSYYALVETLDTQILTDGINQATALAKDQYTPTSWAALTTTLTTAQDVVVNAQEQADIDAAVKNLTQAMDNLVATPDKKALEQAITQAKKAKQTDYEATSWQAFQEKLTQATTVFDDTDATKEEVATAVEQLTKAQKELQTVQAKVDKSQLSAAIKKAEALTSKEYTEKSWQAVETALAKAKEVAKSDATQAVVDDATKALTTAIDKLEKQLETPAVDKQKLAEAIKKAEKLAKEHYTGETWKVFAEKLAAAKKIVDQADVVQQKVDDALTELTKAKEALIAKADKETLGKLIDQALKLKAIDFDTKSWDAFKNSLAEAQVVFNNAKATAQEIADGIKKLEADIAALKAARNTSTRNNLTRNTTTNTTRRNSSFTLPKRTNTTYPTSTRKTSLLPRTGEQFSDYLPIVGGVIVIAGLVIFIKRRKTN